MGVRARQARREVLRRRASAPSAAATRAGEAGERRALGPWLRCPLIQPSKRVAEPGRSSAPCSGQTPPPRPRSRGSPRSSVGRGRRGPPAAARRPRPAGTQRRLRAGSWAAPPPGIGGSGSRGTRRLGCRVSSERLPPASAPLRRLGNWDEVLGTTGPGPCAPQPTRACLPGGPLGGRGRCPRTTPRRGRSCRARPDLPAPQLPPQLLEVGVSPPTAPAGPQCPCGTRARHGASAPGGADLGQGTDMPDLLKDPVPRSSPSAGRRRCRRKGRK